MTLNQDILIQQGANFSFVIPLVDANNNPLVVTGMTANAVLKRDIYSANTSNTYLIPFSCALANGSLTISLTSNTTATLFPFPHPYSYDAVVNEGGANGVVRVASGLADIDPGVTGVLYQDGTALWNANDVFIGD